MTHPFISSKLPQVGTTIFAQMAQLMQRHDAINLAQGFPDFDTSEELIGLVHKYMLKGFNQYSLMPGVLPLREQIARMTTEVYGYSPDPETEITITCGATEACFVAISSVVKPGDEVIIFEPAFDSYAAAVELCGGVPVFIQMHYPHFAIDWQAAREKISEKTRMLILNSPHNPTGSIISVHDIHELQSIVEGNDIVVLSDEVYEHMVFDGLSHESMLKYESLRAKSFVVSSLGKTFHCTGWRVGYCIAPSALTKEFRKVHQYAVYSTITPVQYAMADYLASNKSYKELPSFFQKKRDYFLKELSASKFELYPARGAYFQLASYKSISDETDVDFAKKLVFEHKVAAIPLSYFYHNKLDEKIIRFCFAKKEETLRKATAVLCKI